MSPDPPDPKPIHDSTTNQPASEQVTLPGVAPGLPAASESATLPPSLSAALSASSPVSVPGYEILAELGRGGMGVVYKARQEKLNRIVALKMILSGAHAGEADLARFRIEAETVARMQHPNIVQIYDVGEHEGRPFFALELCSGGSLETKLAGKPLTSTEAAELVETLARAVEAAHRRHVLHRDLKPANVLFTADGQPKITDFGLAKKLDEVGQTATGAVMGTPSYMAPEQAGSRAKELGPATDVYALGAILYECLTGRPPFREATALDTILQVVTDDPVPPRRRNARVDADLEAVCLKCLAKAPGERYGSALALADDLARFRASDRPIHAHQLDEWEAAVRWVRKFWITATLTVVTVAILLLVYLASAAFFAVLGLSAYFVPVAWIPGFLAVMALLVRPRPGMVCFSLLFLGLTIGLPWIAWAILAKPVATVQPVTEASSNGLALAISTAAGVLTAGLFGGLSFGIARWFRCQMLSVFFGGMAGAATITTCCSCGLGMLIMALWQQAPLGRPALAGFITIGTYLLGPLLGFMLGAVLTARLSSRRLATR